ncbi:hypothetical protein F5B21DRAFT_510295 [Xylaria acuta]|nr:hypothetical protein F5B21DRAFT_510295 [Xylaria acuta]
MAKGAMAREREIGSDVVKKHFPLAAQRYDLIVRLYKPVLELLSFEKDHGINQRRLKRAFETLLLWGQQYEVSIRELNRLIDRSWRLWRSILRALTSLTPRIQRPLPEQLQKTSSLLRKARDEAIFVLADNRESGHAGEGPGDDDSGTSSVLEVDSLSEIAEDLTSNVEYLMDLDALYDAAKENTDFYEEDPVAKVLASLASAPSLAAKVYTEMIQMRFPEANCELLDYLCRANYYRLVRGSQKREDNERQAEGDPEMRGHDAITVYGSRFYDSGIGTSLYTGSYAEIVMSFHHENGGIVRIPPLHGERKRRLPFSCIACGKRVIIRSNRAWKRHPFLDLEPYNCLETSCRHTMSLLGGHENWVEHLAVHHGYGDRWQSFQCSLCLEETGQGEANVTIHLEKHLQDIALTALPNNRDGESEAESYEASIPSTQAGGEMHGKGVTASDFGAYYCEETEGDNDGDNGSNDNDNGEDDGVAKLDSDIRKQFTKECLERLEHEAHTNLQRECNKGNSKPLEREIDQSLAPPPKGAGTTTQAEHTTHTAGLSSYASNSHDQCNLSGRNSHASLQSAETNSNNKITASADPISPIQQQFLDDDFLPIPSTFYADGKSQKGVEDKI